MRAIVLLLSAVLCCGGVHAAVPRQINYQGYLTNPGGTPVNATVQMVLNLYNVGTGGAALYTETQMVTVTNGVFNVLIGSPTPIPESVPFDQPYYLGVTVGGDAEMAPRQPIAASPYAISAANATGAMNAARNVIVVSPSGGHFTTISAALASILDASTTNRYLIYVGPGTYTETVTMKQFVDIQGAGELATRITQVGNATGAATVEGASNAELRFLTVENTGGSAVAIAMRNVGASPSLTHVTMIASGGIQTTGIRNLSSSPTIRFSTVSATSVNVNYGVYNSDSSPTIESSSVSASGGISFGIYNATTGGSFSVKVTNSKVVGSFSTINTIPSYTTLVVASQLSGGAVGGGGTVTCIATYDENFVAPGYTTCP